ncbi:MAG: NB-ARC domain-containing protein [Thermoplasmata archaeon]
MRIEDLSVNERILIHLRDFSMDPVNEGASLGQTQEGIAEAIGIRINHVPRATGNLLGDGYVEEALVHIGGLKRKRKAFSLTAKGMEMSLGLISKLKGQSVMFRDLEGAEKSLTIQDILFNAKNATPSSVIMAYFRDGVVLEASLAGEAGRGFISNLDVLPIPINFIGRAAEMGFLRERIGNGERLLVISGIKGIGKTSLGWKVLKEFEGRKNIMWYSAHEWDSVRSMLERISEFLVHLGRNELRKYLRVTRDVDVGQGAAALFRDIRDSDTVMVLDNIFDLKKEVMQFVHLVCEESHKMENSTIIIMTRDRESLMTFPGMDGGNELVLKGLERDSAMRLMTSMGMDPEDGDRVFAMTQGHPLAIKLVNSDEIRKTIDTKGLTKEEVWVVRCMRAFDAILRD